ncbi:hypothetical protein HG530_003297 [Fusarium avenaceum]|nr:hypothetical protein HG530_003297 [Fusarium avenaceum]
MKVGITHVAIAKDINNGVVRRVTQEAGLCQTGLGAAPVAQALGDALTPAPQVAKLCLVLGDDTVSNNLTGHDILEECLKLCLVVLVIGTAHGNIHGRRALGTLDGDLCDNAQSTLGTNEELLHIVAGVVLSQGAQVINDGAIGHHSLNTQNGAVQTAVRVDGLEDTASVDDKRAADLVEGADLVHAGHANDNLVENGDGASHEACISSLGHDSQTLLVAVLEDAANLVSGAGPEHQLGLALVLVHPILVVRLKVGRVDARPVRDAVDDGRGVVTQDLTEARNMLGRDFSEPGVALELRVRLGRQLCLLSPRRRRGHESRGRSRDASDGGVV